jgi:hypothetical protein
MTCRTQQAAASPKSPESPRPRIRMLRPGSRERARLSTRPRVAAAAATRCGLRCDRPLSHHGAVCRRDESGDGIRDAGWRRMAQHDHHPSGRDNDDRGHLIWLWPGLRCCVLGCPWPVRRCLSGTRVPCVGSRPLLRCGRRNRCGSCCRPFASPKGTPSRPSGVPDDRSGRYAAGMPYAPAEGVS